MAVTPTIRKHLQAPLTIPTQVHGQCIRELGVYENTCMYSNKVMSLISIWVEWAAWRWRVLSRYRDVMTTRDLSVRCLDGGLLASTALHLPLRLPG